ncbi:MAG: hypothetical protein O2963_05560 [Proteobacteria bacterium]|jgi:hypothetical protein|nr:hypothetical protein [Pseudomonadota bacterium]
MAKYNVTLKSELKRGVFYWVATVTADSEDEAIVAAEHLFLDEMNGAKEWNFTDYDAEEI